MVLCQNCGGYTPYYKHWLVRVTILSNLKLVILSRRRPNEWVREDHALNRLLQDHCLEPHVKVISGFLEPDALVSNVADADIITLPFELLPSDAPLSILEALALGKPIVTTRVACLPELVSSGEGYLAEPGDPNSLSEAIERAADPPGWFGEDSFQSRKECCPQLAGNGSGMVELPAEPVEIPKNLARFIYITGCDGTGKTTQVCLLLEKLQAAGVKDPPCLATLPIFLQPAAVGLRPLARLSWYEQSGDIKHGYWDFSRSRLLQNILPWLLLLDASLAGFTKIYLPIWRGETVICERFVLDMLVDLSLAFGGKDLYKQLPGRLYLKLLPRNAKIFILNLDAATIRNSKSRPSNR